MWNQDYQDDGGGGGGGGGYDGGSGGVDSGITGGTDPNVRPPFRVGSDGWWEFIGGVWRWMTEAVPPEITKQA